MAIRDYDLQEDEIINDFRQRFIKLCFSERLPQSTTNKIVKLLEEFAKTGKNFVKCRMESKNHSDEATFTAVHSNPFCEYLFNFYQQHN